MIGNIFGRYRITHKLGEGGMAEVWAAVHEVSEREAVVKMLRPEMSSREQLLKRFLQEAKAAARIDDPGIVNVIDVGHALDGRAYLILERLCGETLGDRLKEHGTLCLDKAICLMRQLARTMGVAHARDIIHRDLKPDNIFLTPDPEVRGGERVKVLDFGLAKLTRATGSVRTVEGTVFGTPAYMAPEQCQDSANVDRRADLYSIGCIFYRCLCGHPPFGTGGLEVLQAQLRDAPVPPEQLQPAIPSTLSALILQLLDKSPDRRISSCEEFLRALDNAESPVCPTPVSINNHRTIPVERPGGRTVLSARADEKTLLDRGEAEVSASGSGTAKPDSPLLDSPTIIEWSAPRRGSSGAEGSVPSVDGVELCVRHQAAGRKWLTWAAIAVVFMAISLAAALVPVPDDAVGPVDSDLPDGLPAERAEVRDRVASPASADDNKSDNDGKGSDGADAASPPEAAPVHQTIEDDHADQSFDDMRAQAEDLVRTGECKKLENLLTQNEMAAHVARPRHDVFREACQIRRRQIRRIEAEKASKRKQIVAEIIAAASNEEYGRAQQLCAGANRFLRGDNRMLAICAIAACKTRNQAAAKRYFRRLSSSHQSAVQQSCLQEGIRLSSSKSTRP
ncbi:MAG: serine/threonine protein kinase [Proteobacteria bacterium]|nr:serine/threonine protein kinase [Pseudomonadota bacterium]